MANPKYAYWEARQRGEDPQAVNEQPECGFYRVRRQKRAPFVPLAIYTINGEIVGYFGTMNLGDSLNADQLARMWPWACQNDISEAVYRDVAENGKDWPDIDATVSAAQRGPGDNRPPTDEAELLAEQIEAARGGLKDYAEIKDDDHNARAQTLWSRLRELHNLAKKTRARLKVPYQPALDAVDAIDAKLMPLEKSTKAGADEIRKAQDAFATKKIRQQEAAQAEIDAERTKLEAAGVRVPQFAPAPALPSQVKGAIGRASHVGKKTVVARVTDWPALYAHFAEEKDVREALVRLANIAVGMGHSCPGVETEEIGKVR